ncbi:MAG: mechanosensitive ion channel [bacterium]|nr:MAG: mechanosensitive ion channel [bacterium]
MSIFTHFFSFENQHQIYRVTEKNRKKFMPRQRTVFNIALLFLIIFLTTAGIAQSAKDVSQKESGSETVAQPAEKKPELLPIGASDIPKVSEMTVSQLDEIRNKIEPQDVVAKVVTAFEEIQSEINQLDSELSEVDLLELKFSRLVAIQTSWESVKASMSIWQNTLQSRSQEFESFGQNLKEKQKLWEMTREASAERADPKAIQLRVTEVLDSISNVDKILKTRQEAILTLMDKVSQASIRINKALSKISDAQAQSREKMFAIDSPPLWKAFKWKEERPSFSFQMKQTIKSRLSILDKFVHEQWPRIIIHFGIFLLVSLILLSVRRRGDSWSDPDGSSSRFKFIYHHPFSSGLLLSLIFTSYIYQNPPEYIRQLNRLIFLIPLLRILPKIIHHEMRKPFYWLAGLYVFQRMDELIIDFTLAHRLILLFITLITFAGLLWILRPGSPILQRKGGLWQTSMFNLSRLALILLGVSLLANIFGNVSLADLLTNATLNTAYVAVGIFTAVLVLESIIVISMQIRSLSNLRIVQKNAQLIEKRIVSLVRLTALILWLAFSLENYDIYDPLKKFIQNFFSKSWQLGNFSFAIGDLLIFFITIWLSILISRLIRFILEEDVLPRLPLPRGVPASISILTNYTILAIGFLVALTAAGIEWSKFALLAGAFGVGIGFGLQNVVNNFISGLILIFERPVKVGDTVEVGILKGTVKRIGIRSSTVRTFDGAEVIVPNGTLIQSEVTNWTLSDQLRRIEVKVGVSYGSDPNQVLKILKKVADDHEGALEYPAPMVLFLGFGESSLDFSLRVWTSDFDNWIQFSSEITLQVHNALKEAGIEIPFPQRDLHLRSVSKDIPHLLKPAEKKTNGKGKTETSKAKE